MMVGTMVPRSIAKTVVLMADQKVELMVDLMALPMVVRKVALMVEHWVVMMVE